MSALSACLPCRACCAGVGRCMCIVFELCLFTSAAAELQPGPEKRTAKSCLIECLRLPLSILLQGAQPHHPRQPKAGAGCCLRGLPGSIPAGGACCLCV